MNKFDNGENAYHGFDSQEKRDKDAAELAELADRLESLGGEPPSSFKSLSLKSTKVETDNKVKLNEKSNVGSNQEITPSQEPTGKRVALLVGNSKYNTSPLKNPVNDIDLLEKALKETGFEVLKVSNVDRSNFKRALG